MEEVKKQEMESLFCPYKQSLALKELRFEEPCMRGWDKNGKIWYHPDSDIVLDNPTFSQAFRFLERSMDYIILFVKIFKWMVMDIEKLFRFLIWKKIKIPYLKRMKKQNSLVLEN